MKRKSARPLGASLGRLRTRIAQVKTNYKPNCKACSDSGWIITLNDDGEVVDSAVCLKCDAHETHREVRRVAEGSDKRYIPRGRKQCPACTGLGHISEAEFKHYLEKITK